MRRMRWAAALAALTVLIASTGVALAREGEEREPGEIEAEGADKVAEIVPLTLAGQAAADILGQAVAGGPAAGGGSPQASSASTKGVTFFADQELPCSTDLDGALTGCGQALEPEVKSG